MVLALDDHFVIVAVVAVNEEGKKLQVYVSEQLLEMRFNQLTNVTKNASIAMIASAQLALSIAHVLLTLSE